MTITATDLVVDRRGVSMPVPAEFPCCGRGASLGDDRLAEIADQLARGADEVVLDRKCGGVDCKDPETGRRGIRYRLLVRYSPANGLCGPEWPLLRAEWERIGVATPEPELSLLSDPEPATVPESVLFATQRNWVDTITPAVIRAWAIDQGIPCGARGRIHPSVAQQYAAAHA